MNEDIDLLIEQPDEKEKVVKKEIKKEQPNDVVNDDLTKKKEKDEQLLLASNPDNDLIKKVEEPVEKEETEVEKKLTEVSRASGLNLKAYFVEENKEEISKENLGYTNFKFNGNMKEFYSQVYRHVLESNLIARQLAPVEDRENFPTFKQLAEKFEEFMKVTGEELVKRGHLEKYEPFGGLSASEIKEIENSCLLNRPRSEKEAIERNISNIKGKDFDEVVERGYQRATETISTLYGHTYKKGDDPEKDRMFLQTAANLIKGMSMLRKSEKIWQPYIPDFSAPKWDKPIHKHLIANGLKAIRKGISIVFDSTVKFGVINAKRGLLYPFNKLASVISAAYNERKLDNLVYAKGFSKDDLKRVISSDEKPSVNVEEDAKAIEENFKINKAKIEEHKAEQNKEKVEEVDKKEVIVKEHENENEHKKLLIIEELNDNVPTDNLVPKINDEQNKTKQLVNNV
jgi:hypothetical protein